MDALLKRLKEERESKVTFIENLTTTAVDEKRDLSTSELELIKRSKDRIGEIDGQLDVVAVDVQLSQDAQDRLAKLSGAVGAPSGPDSVDYVTAGAYLREYLTALIGDGPARTESETRLRRYHRAAAHVTTAQFAGIFPQAIVGPIINLINTSRPLVSAVGVTGVPSGPSFRRPRLVDPNVATGVGPQANQKDELASQQFSIQSDQVDLTTLGGYVNVARQVLDWGVASLDLIVNQLAARYAYATERAAITELAKSTGKVTLATGTVASDVLQKAIFDAAAQVYSTTGQLPTILAAGPLGWARLGSTVDGAKRPLFPFLAPANAAGTADATSFAANPVGLRLVVTPGVTDDSYWVLNGFALEAYEQLVGQLSVVEPSVLGIQVAYAGYTGFYRPAPNGAVHLAP